MLSLRGQRGPMNPIWRFAGLVELPSLRGLRLGAELSRQLLVRPTSPTFESPTISAGIVPMDTVVIPSRSFAGKMFSGFLPRASHRGASYGCLTTGRLLPYSRLLVSELYRPVGVPKLEPTHGREDSAVLSARSL
jgi:hypothetical protein